MPVERELRFAEGDVELFAVASGDRNPLHVDPEFAAGTAFGAPIVHGSLIVIAMLGAIPEQQLSEIRSLRVSFSGALLRDATASLSASALEREPGAWEMRLAARGKTLARVLARAAREPLESASTLSTSPGERPSAMRTAPAESSVSDLSAAHTLRCEYAAGPELTELALRLGAGALDPRLLEGLAWASYVVGMEIPGLHSLFAGLALGADHGARDDDSSSSSSSGTVVVREHDERTGQLTIDAALARRSRGGRALAAIQCFALPGSITPDPAMLRFDRAPERDRGAVVVAGGSRGFGASVSLALLALGYEVHVAYATSRRRAAELKHLAGPHAPRLHLTQADVSEPGAMRSLADTVAEAGAPLVGLVLNAALPPLAMGLTPGSATDLADYVAASLRLVTVPLASLLGAIDEQRGWVLFCSSAAIVAPPRDWPHYVTAKGAVEGLAGWVAATKPRLRTVIVRPPKMQTAMTGTPSGRIGAESPDAVALWTVEKLAGGELEPGLTTLEPGTRAGAAV
ncbi:MAG TPA: SDR family NAD(P)-dependent oxidoreductase [Solirubrobacteraceae bacterium]|nr:SDR family NAD(P)-dependent oxidoreductase [Solirubrobacteraceae bacterium]